MWQSQVATIAPPKLFIAIDLCAHSPRWHHQFDQESYIVRDKVSSMHRPDEFHTQAKIYFHTYKPPSVSPHKCRILLRVREVSRSQASCDFTSRTNQRPHRDCNSLFLWRSNSVRSCVNLSKCLEHNGNVRHVINWFRSQIAKSPSLSIAYIRSALLRAENVFYIDNMASLKLDAAR